jgi:hypothetical protein
MPESATTADPTTFLKRHGFAIAGVALPLLVVFLFVLARTLPQVLVEAPRYDLVYSTVAEPTSAHEDILCELGVVEGRLRARWIRKQQPVYAPTLRVYRLRPATGVLTELAVPEPASLDDLQGTQDLYFAGLDDVRIDTSPRAPDGYGFESSYAGGSGLFGGLYFGGSRGPRATIQRDGRVIALPRVTVGGYGYDAPQWLGWALPLEGGR